ncbi:MAG: pilus assembly protein TadG-related protein [Acidimicrobiales bacterium]
MRHPLNEPGRDSGSVTFLFPVGLLIVVMLGAITIDLANVWLQQRRLADLADAVANDAVAFALDQDSLRRDGEIVIDPARLDFVLRTAIDGYDSSSVVVADARSVTTPGAPAVVVSLESDVALIFGRILRDEPVAIRATAFAELIREPSVP